MFSGVCAMSGIGSVGQNTLPTPVSTSPSIDGAFQLASAVIAPALPLDAHVLRVLQTAFPSGSVQSAMTAASPTMLAAFKAMLGVGAGATVSSFAEWIAGRVTGQIPSGISARDMQFAGSFVQQLGLSAGEVQNWSDEQKVFLIKGLSALQQAEIYGDLSPEQAGGVAHMILERTRSNDLAIAPAQTGASSGPLVQPIGSGRVDANAIPEGDLDAMMLRQAENFARGTLTGESAIVHQDGMVLPPPTELDPSDIGNSRTGERLDLIPLEGTAAGQPVPGSGQGGERPDISNIFPNPGDVPQVPPHTGAPREDFGLELPVMSITDAGGGDVGSPEAQIRGKLALLARGLDGAPVAQSVGTLVEDINNGYFNTGVEAKRAIASDIIFAAAFEGIIAGEDVNVAFSRLQLPGMEGFLQRSAEFGLMYPGQTVHLSSGLAGHRGEASTAARVTMNGKEEFFVEPNEMILFKLPGEFGWDLLAPGESFILPPGTAVQNFAGEVSLLGQIGEVPVPRGFLLNPADWGSVAPSSIPGLTDAVFQNRANQIVNLGSLSPEGKAEAILELMQDMGVQDSSGSIRAAISTAAEGPLRGLELGRFRERLLKLDFGDDGSGAPKSLDDGKISGSDGKNLGMNGEVADQLQGELSPDTQAAWEFLSGVAVGTTGNVMGAVNDAAAHAE
jgi:hypothetical protein